MNRSYWTRVALGALLVFGLGLAGLAAVNRGKAEVQSLLSTAVRQLPLQLAKLDFSLDGRKIGTVSGIDVQRTDPADPGRVKLRVTLADAADLGRLESCRLTSDDLDRFPNSSGFRCADAAEIGAGLVEMGEVVFQPAELVRPLYLPNHTIERWRRSEVRSLDASLTADGRGGVTGQGRFEVAKAHRGVKRGTFRLEADERGAVISIQDHLGRSLFDFSATENGVSMKIKK
ncbi:MAG TPA: hypothetical protein VIQ98_04545 [Gemmatimonadales bacterium]|jgi:hypothetical protein